MPNGHGGIPRFGSPALLIIGLVVLLWLRISWGAEWTILVAYPVAGLFAWRLAWHIHLYSVTDYGGAYASSEDLARAERRFRRTLLLTVPLALLGVHALWP